MKKLKVKHPLCLALFVDYFTIFGTTAIMINLDAIFKFSNLVNGIIISTVTIITIVEMLFLLKNLGKYLKRERKTKLEKIRKYAFSEKEFVLVRKRNIFGNLILVFSGLFVYMTWLLFFPYGALNTINFWIFRIISLFCLILGIICSFIIPKKMLIFKNGELIINTEEISKTIKPDEIIDVKNKHTYPKNKVINKKNIYYDVVLILENEEIILLKADSVWGLKDILKEIKYFIKTK